jgi:hypothetical protein
MIAVCVADSRAGLLIALLVHGCEALWIRFFEGNYFFGSQAFCANFSVALLVEIMTKIQQGIKVEGILSMAPTKFGNPVHLMQIRAQSYGFQTYRQAIFYKTSQASLESCKRSGTASYGLVGCPGRTIDRNFQVPRGIALQ